MARTKNREYQQVLSPAYTFSRRWKMGGYIRLSKEDLKKALNGKDDSNSVKNQRDLLNDFYRKYQEEFESITEYVDDGHTGTDSDREAFQQLLADVMSRKIDCVVVKDLSRFARNYSDAGSLIDNLFVQMGVRFISLAENVDSYKDPDSVSSIIVPITNVMNDQYCYQTSKKIRQVFDYKRRNGQYIGSNPPFGYVKDAKDRHHLVIDPDAAEIVRLIFSLLLKGTSKRGISFYLNEHGIPSPSVYKLEKGMTVSNKPDGNTLWSGRMIHTILTNPMYTGDLVQGRFRVKSYKVHQIETVPEEEWVRVADTHEAIIDKATFEKVQELRFGIPEHRHRGAPSTCSAVFSNVPTAAEPLPAVPARTTCITPALPIRAVQEMPAQCTLSVMPGWRPPCCTPSGSRCILLSPIQKSSPKSIQPLSKKTSLSDWTIRFMQKNVSLPK